MPTKLTNVLDQTLEKLEIGSFFYLKKHDYESKTIKDLAHRVHNFVKRKNLAIVIQTERVSNELKVKRIK